MLGKYRALWLNKDGFLEVIDQTKLPFEQQSKVLKTTDEVVEAIKDMTVRGAGVIGSVAAFGIYTAAMELNESYKVSSSEREGSLGYEKLQAKALLIRESRPTAVNLMWAVDKMMEFLKNSNDLVNDAKRYAIELNDKEALESQKIAEYGCDIIENILKKKNKTKINILTHCNAGWLAVIDEGTALAPIYEAQRRGIDVHVWVDETRPRNQGASLTAWELTQSGINHTIIADNTGGHLMQIGEVDMVITGADRVSANGDVANKIGTYLKALAAYDNNVPFYVAIPASTFDFDIIDGLKDIPIELRSADEVRCIKGVDADGVIREVLITPKDSPAINYGFDVTPARLITGLITNKGVCEADFDKIKEKFIVEK
ncbi:S-methyl-5-thioribose-1-phosphate isomerase [Sulfurimonas sp.]|uniref:S-methyl-5-thioribose-1-phosphate isomerase n=1 Tax=Sulfurimonas sp. TaxID=2022749 RepID=UPI0026384B42|nr:S-methyl-5-thioribose-1-phosphate isomerase [Sulfurimonas sp.]MCW8895445.1 S-methyl-5-thioribose-1-phosphate isomerase [Sulfurimonas sp.]MCW9067400.1 S-methyl-5-thioribose-1-phosphate isomerase [Sulfurimonas sp.]